MKIKVWYYRLGKINNGDYMSAFVRALWGSFSLVEGKSPPRRIKIENDIKMALKHDIQFPFCVYVFGEENAKILEDYGCTVKLLDKRSIVWDMDKQQFRHKLEVFNVAAQEHKEMLFLDWDTLPIKQIPVDFWETFKKKESLQATLLQYKRVKVGWRGSGDCRKIPSGSFVYCRDEAVTAELIKTWERLGNPWSEEVVMARYLDDVNGKWVGTDEFLRRYDPELYYLPRQFVWGNDVREIKKQNAVFCNFNHKQPVVTLGNNENKYKEFMLNGVKK